MVMPIAILSGGHHQQGCQHRLKESLWANPRGITGRFGVLFLGLCHPARHECERVLLT